MIKKYMAAALVAAALSFAVKPAAAIPEGLRSFLDGQDAIKVCIELTNSSGDDKVDINLLKEHLEEAFLARKAHRFTVVEFSDEADMILKGNVIEYIWLKNDPVDQVWGLGSAAMDAAMSENYARIQVDTELISAKHDKLLWSDRIQATMTQPVMLRDASYDLIYHRFVKSLMIELFKRRRR